MTIATRTKNQQVAAPASCWDNHHADLLRQSASRRRQGRFFALCWVACLVGGLLFVLGTVFV
jgi:hypothetical protein